MDEQKGYMASDGSMFSLSPPSALPDGEIELDQFREFARASAAKTAQTSYRGLFDGLYQTFHEPEVLPSYLVRETMSSRRFRRIEEILFAARAHREANAEANADALIDCLMSADTAHKFHSLLPSVLGFPPLARANGYTSWMERENPWVMRLLESLPYAKLVPALSVGLAGYIFDPYRPIFHEPSLAAFLNSPFGDLRHLEGNMPLDHNRLDLGIGFKDVVLGGTMEILKATQKLERRLAKIKAERPPSEPFVSQVLGVDLSEGELDGFGQIGHLIERAAREIQPVASRRPRGFFLAYYLRYGGSNNALTQVPKQALWPYLSERLDIIDIAFGLDKDVTVDHGYEPHFAAELLRHLPKTPNRYKDTLYRMALGRKRSGRMASQRLLKGAQGLLPRLEKSLNARSKDERLQAALILGRLDNKAGSPILKARFAKEKVIDVKNACVVSLKSLGADIRAFGPNHATMIEEARSGLGKPLPEKRAFLANLELPDLLFEDGTPAPLELAPWLVRLAADMGIPSSNALLNLRVAHLDKGSRVALAQAVLEGWVRNDTLTWKEISFETHRALFEPEMYKIYLEIHDLGAHWYSHRYVPGKPPKSPAQHAADISAKEIAEFLRCKSNWGTYVFSSYDAKGALALCGALPVSEVRKTVRLYLKHYSGRGPQIKAMMSLLASYPGKTPINELFRIADTQKQKTLRQHAIDLLDDLGHPYAPPLEEHDKASQSGIG